MLCGMGGAAVPLECVVHVLEFLQHQSGPCSKGFTSSLVPSWSNFLHFPYFELWVFAQAECLFFFSFPACVYICKVGVGRANAWSIRNWNGMSQGWLKAKMKYISLGSRGAWGSPVILDNLFFFHLLSPIRTSADLLFWVLGSPCWAIRALLERGQKKVQAVGSVLVCLALSCPWEVACVPEESPPSLGTGATSQWRTELLSPPFSTVLTENGAHWVYGAWPAWHPRGAVPPWHCAVCHLCPCRCQWQAAAVRASQPPQDSVRSAWARAGMHF